MLLWKNMETIAKQTSGTCCRPDCGETAGGISEAGGGVQRERLAHNLACKV